MCSFDSYIFMLILQPAPRPGRSILPGWETKAILVRDKEPERQG